MNGTRNLVPKVRWITSPERAIVVSGEMGGKNNTEFATQVFFILR